MPQLLFHKQELAWLVNRKWALGALFGDAYAAQFAPLDEVALQTAALALFHEAIQQGHFPHGVFIERRLEELIQARSFAEQIPYTPDFEAAFAPALAHLDLLLVADYLYLLCMGYATEYPSFFQPAVDGYQYLLDVLVRAQHQQLVAATPSLARAQGWLQDQLTAPAPPLRPSPAARGRPRTVPRPGGWLSILPQAQTHPQAEVEELLLTLALLTLDATGQLRASPETAPGSWVGAVRALQQAGYLIANHAVVARVLQAQYGDVVSERALQRGVRPDNEVHGNSYHRAQAWLHQRAGR